MPTLTEKRCPKCGKVKPLTEFHKGEGLGGKRSHCAKCSLKYNQKWRRDHPERWRELIKKHSGTPGARNTHFKRKYGITLADYNRMLNEQNGLCASCHRPNTTKHRLYVDHDHKTGRVRGLLCHHCNVILGMAKDDPQILLKVIEYLVGDKNNADADVTGQQPRLHAG